ncbi:MAG TPA: hypothetical protein VMS71_05830, partial [Candidatus Acidoferrum sp.]|nr:hypothetical protein [Candidatus Acidoferrum sp.]
MRNYSKQNGRVPLVRHGLVITFLLLVFAGGISAQSNITCPAGPIGVCLPGPGQACVNLPILPGVNVTVDGAIWENGQLCFNVQSAGQYQYTVIAAGDTLTDTCLVTVDVSFGTKPVIICPSEPIKVSLCQPGEVCFAVATKNAMSVSAANAAFRNGQLCFMADTSGLYTTQVIATGTCGADTCMVGVQVTITGVPTITCASSQYLIEACPGQHICLPVPVTGADSVKSALGTWSSDSLCFTADTVGAYNIPVTAYSRCGTASCTVRAGITILQPPTFRLTDTLFSESRCGSGSICVPLVVEIADSVVVKGGTWSNNQLCFEADTTGVYRFDMTAHNRCGTSELKSFPVTVTIKNMPAIACPSSVAEISVCSGYPQLSWPLAIRFADSVRTNYGTWVDDSVLFPIDTAGLYAIGVQAFNSCGVTACTVKVQVNLILPVSIEVPQIEPSVVLCKSGQACAPLVIKNADQVTVSTGSWANDTICFEADTSGLYTFSVSGTNRCGTVTVPSYHIQVTLKGIPVLACSHDTIFDTTCTGNVCVPFKPTVSNYDSVVVRGAAWHNDTLCFEAPQSEVYGFYFVAFNGCGADSCLALVKVEKQTGGVVNGQPLTFDTTVCSFGNICVRVPVDTTYTVAVPGATWHNQLLCFDAEHVGQYDFTVTGTALCSQYIVAVAVNVKKDSLPHIDIPEDPEQVVACAPETTYVPLTIVGAELVTVDNNGFWSDGKLRFVVDTTGL